MEVERPEDDLDVEAEREESASIAIVTEPLAWTKPMKSTLPAIESRKPEGIWKVWPSPSSICLANDAVLKDSVASR